MANQEPIAQGKVFSLAINGARTNEICFDLRGPDGDIHQGFTRKLSGHDGDYIRSSDLNKGHSVFNWRTWTATSIEEMRAVSQALGHDIPAGCLLENIVFEGIPNFSDLPPTSRLVFPSFFSPIDNNDLRQAVLAVWEQNGPCRTVGERLEEHHEVEGLKTNFIREAQGKRGLMGFVLSAGSVAVGDEVLVYPPVK